jgi:hypothetical protein
MHALKTYHLVPGNLESHCTLLTRITNHHRAGGITDWKDDATSFGIVGSPVTEDEATSVSEIWY